MKKKWLAIILGNCILAWAVFANPVTLTEEYCRIIKVLLVPVFNRSDNHQYAYLTDYITNALKVNLRQETHIQVLTIPLQLLDKTYAPSRLTGDRTQIRLRLERIRNLNQIDESNQITSCILAEFKAADDSLLLTIHLYELENLSLVYHHNKRIRLGLDILRETEIIAAGIVRTLNKSHRLINANTSIPDNLFSQQKKKYAQYMPTAAGINVKADFICSGAKHELLVSMPIPTYGALNLNFGVALDYNHFPGMEYRLQLLNCLGTQDNDQGTGATENPEVKDNEKKDKDDDDDDDDEDKDNCPLNLPNLSAVYSQPFSVTFHSLRPEANPGSIRSIMEQVSGTRPPERKTTDVNLTYHNDEDSMLVHRLSVIFPLYLNYSMQLDRSSSVNIGLHYNSFSIPFRNLVFQTLTGETIILDAPSIKAAFLSDPANVTLTLNISCFF